jgi:hypothetical protein
MVFWTTNGESRHATITTKQVLLLPLKYLEYVKDSNPDAHVKKNKVAIRANGETKDVRIVNMFSFTLRDVVFDWCNNYMGDYPYCIFVKLQLTFCKRYKKV